MLVPQYGTSCYVQEAAVVTGGATVEAIVTLETIQTTQFLRLLLLKQVSFFFLSKFTAVPLICNETMISKELMQSFSPAR